MTPSDIRKHMTQFHNEIRTKHDNMNEGVDKTLSMMSDYISLLAATVGEIIDYLNTTSEHKDSH